MGCWSVVVRPIDSCDVHTRLENLLPLHEPRAARPEARRVPSGESISGHRHDYVSSPVSLHLASSTTPLVHSCATLDCTWFAAHALSSRCPQLSPLRTSYTTHTRYYARTVTFLSALSLRSLEGSAVSPIFFPPCHAR